jgi:hypothetical protein
MLLDYSCHDGPIQWDVTPRLADINKGRFRSWNIHNQRLNINQELYWWHYTNTWPKEVHKAFTTLRYSITAAQIQARISLVTTHKQTTTNIPEILPKQDVRIDEGWNCVENGCMYLYVSSGYRNNSHNTCALLLRSNAFIATSGRQKTTAYERNFPFISEALHIYNRSSNSASSVLCYVYTLHVSTGT